MKTRTASISITTALLIAGFTAWRYARNREPVVVPKVPAPIVVPMPIAPNAAVGPVPGGTSTAPLPPASEIPPPGPTSVKGTVGESVEYRWAIAIPDAQGYDVRLLSEPIETCGHHEKSEYDHVLTRPSKGHRLRFVLPAGPGNKFFTGHPIGVELVDGGKSLTIFEPARVTANVEPFEMKKGARMKGTLSFSGNHVELGAIHGEGTFDAEICDAPRSGLDLPEAPNQPVSGKIGPIPFQVRSAIAILSGKEKDGYLMDLKLSSTAGLDCKSFVSYDDETKNDVVVVDLIGGGSLEHPLLHTAQPANAVIYTKNKDASWWTARRHTWVRFEQMPKKPGEKVTGSLVAASWPDSGLPEAAGTIAGKFEATVCP